MNGYSLFCSSADVRRTLTVEGGSVCLGRGEPLRCFFRCIWPLVSASWVSKVTGYRASEPRRVVTPHFVAPLGLCVP